MSTEDLQFHELVQRTKAFFLEKLFEDTGSNRRRYDLEEEFAKTKRNRNFVVGGATLIITVVVFLGAWGLNSYYEAQNNAITIGEDVFRDVNLRDLLERAKVLDSALESDKAELERIQRELEITLTSLQAQADQEAQLIRSRNLEPDQTSRQINGAYARARSAQQSAKNQVETQVTEIQARIEATNQALGQLDQAELTVARQQEVLLNAERAVFDREIRGIRDSYSEQFATLTTNYEERFGKQEQFAKELEQSWASTLERETKRLIALYNPTYSDPTSAGLIGARIDEARKSQAWFLVPRNYLQSNLVSAEQVASQNQKVGEYQALLGLLRRIPSEGSVPAIINQIEARLISLMDGSVQPYDRFWARIQAGLEEIERLEKIISDKNTQIAGLERNIADLEKQNSDKAQQIVELQAQLETAKKEYEALTAAKTDLDTQYARLQSEKDTLAASGALATENLNISLSFLSQYAARNNIEAVVVDARDTQKILIYSRSLIPFTTGQTLRINRKNNSGATVRIADVSVTAVGVFATAVLSFAASGQSVQTLDEVSTSLR